MRSRISNLLSRIKVKKPENLRVVFLAVATAAIFWFFNALNKDYDATVGYPVNWEFDAEQYIVVDELPASIRVNVKGLGWTLLRVSLGLKVTPINIALSNPALNKKIAGTSLTNRVDDNLEELQLNYIFEDTLHLNIEPRANRSFGVYIDSANISLAENYRIISPINYDVHLMELEGPRNMVNSNPSDSFLISIKELQLNDNFSEELNFEIERSELFRFNPRSVNVSFDVAEFITAERIVTLERVDFPEDSTVYLSDTTCLVQFLVRKDLEESIVADSFSVVANYALINQTDSTLLLKIEKNPPEILDTRITHPQVRLIYNE